MSGINEINNFYYSNELNNTEQLAKIKSIKCNFQNKNQLTYT